MLKHAHAVMVAYEYGPLRHALHWAAGPLCSLLQFSHFLGAQFWSGSHFIGEETKAQKMKELS